MTNRLVSFIGGTNGPWRVTSMQTIAGEPLSPVERVDIVGSSIIPDPLQNARWQLSGITSNERYVTRTEKQALTAKQQGLGRPEATVAALIPIRKSDAWWNLTQDERRDILEEKSRHIRIGLNYLPAIARRLHHCRDLSERQPFDFLTWFEFSPTHAALFDELTAELRASLEWSYVDREIDIRLFRSD